VIRPKECRTPADNLCAQLHAPKHMSLFSPGFLVQETSPMDAALPGRLELHAGLRPEMISLVRRFIESFFTYYLDEESAYRIGLATHELIDNAVRCAAPGQISFCIETSEDALVIHTRNRAGAGDIAVLERAIAEMGDHCDPLAHYVSLMDRTAGCGRTSGLGLGRIRAEANMTLSCETEADMVWVRARMPLPRYRA
jgi:anti-sigma regulatory factor (Ser/Thr protein kinase)